MEISLKDLMKAVLKYWYILVGAVLVFALIGGVGSKLFIAKKYKSVTSVYVFSESAEGENKSSLATNEVTQYFILTVTSGEMFRNLSSALENKYSAVALLKMINVEQMNKINVVKISCVAESPQAAQSILLEFNKLAGERFADFPNPKYELTMSVVDSPSLPISQDSPNVTLNTVIAALIGFIVGFIVILVMRLSKTNVRDGEEFVALFNVTLLGEIPEGRRKNARGGYYEYQKYSEEK